VTWESGEAVEANLMLVLAAKASGEGLWKAMAGRLEGNAMVPREEW